MRNKTDSGLRTEALLYLNYSFIIFILFTLRFADTNHSLWITYQAESKKKLNAERKRGLNPANCPVWTYHKAQRTKHHPEFNSCLSAYSNTRIHLHSTESKVRDTVQIARSSISYKEKVAEKFPFLEILNTNLSNLSG